MIEFVYTTDFIQLKVITVKNTLLATIGFSTMGLNIKILLVMCHYLLMLCVYISDIAIITVKSADYHCIIYGISKSAAIIS